MMRIKLFIFLLLALSSCTQKPVRVAFIAGMDPVEDVEIYKPLFWDGMVAKVYSTQESFELFKPDGDKLYDVIVFYDIELDEIPAEVKENIVRVIGEEGKPAFIFHDGLLTYNTWEEFARIAGMKYFMTEQVMDGVTFGVSTYKHEQDIPITVVDKEHFITRGMPAEFTVKDEIYDNLWVSEAIHPLWTTTHPDSEDVMLYTHKYGNAKILGVVTGHGTAMFEDPNFQQAFRNGIKWLAR